MFDNLPVELFATGQNDYAFDAGKVVFLKVDKVTSFLLGFLQRQDVPLNDLIARLPQFSKAEIRNSYGEIHRLQEDGYLRPGGFRRTMLHSRSKFEDVLTRRMGGLTVNITTRCNLACSYCIFGGSYGRYRRLSETTMSWTTARNMLDFLIAHSEDSPRIRLDFFGGEPFLAFELMERCVGYLKTAVASRRAEVVVTVASNGTILTDEILRFLRVHGVYLQYSIDGGREVHDRKRRFRSTRAGSYDRIIRNLERIRKADPAYFDDRMRIKSVISFDARDLDDDGFYDHPLLLALRDTGQATVVLKEPDYRAGEDAAYFAGLVRVRRKLLGRRHVRTLDELRAGLSPRERVFFNGEFGSFLDVQAVNAFYFGSSKAVPFIKGCLIGCENAAVDPDGKILVCHKATSFVIGDVNRERWDLDKIWGIYRSLHEDFPDCASCFVQRFCNLCFEKLDARDWVGSRRNLCDFTRKKYRMIFDTMLRVLDRNPGLWDDFRRVVSRDINARIEEMGLEA